jgi:hypothetical protein
MLKLLILTAALALAATPAHADPISLTIAGINALLSTSLTSATVLGTIGSVSITVGQVVGTALALGTGLLSTVLGRTGKKQRPQTDPSAGKNTFETSEAGEIRTIGRVRIGGLKIFGNTADLDRYRLIAHSRGPVDGVEEHFLGGREVIVESDGAVSTPPYRHDAGSYIYIYPKPGSPGETAYPGLITAFPNLWTAAHRVRGIAQSLLRYVSPGMSGPDSEKFLQLYQSGPPDYDRVQRGELMYDPRTGLNAWSDNGVIAVLHVLLGFPEFSAADFDLGFIADEADRADVLVATRTGSEKRSRAWGLWDDANTDRGDLLRDVLLSTGCEIVARPGDLLGIVLIDDARPAEVTIPAKHILDLVLKAGPEGVERPNRCRVKYYSSERNYELAEVNLVQNPDVTPAVPLAWSVAQEEIDRVGERPVEYVLPFCPSAAQAQRIARRLFEMARADSGIAEMNFAGLALWGVRTAGFEVADLETTLICEVQPARVDDERGRVELPFIVAPDLPAWNPALHEALAPDTLPDLQYYSPSLAAPGAVGPMVVVQYPSGAFESRLGFPSIPGGITAIEPVFRRWLGADRPTEWRGMIADPLPYGWASGSLIGSLTDFRLRIFDADNNPTPWSPVLSLFPAIDNSAPAAPAITAVFIDNGGAPGVHDQATVTVTAPQSLQVASVVMTGPGAPSGPQPAKPAQVWSWVATLPERGPVQQDITFTAAARSSNGTASATVSATVTVPATAP